MITCLVLVFIVLLLLGAPIAYCMGAGAYLSMAMYMPQAKVQVIAKMFGGLDSFSLMAVPFFILAGNLMDSSGISRQLVDFANMLVGRIKGGLAMTAVVSGVIFAGVSGSASADTSALAAILIPPMTEEGYEKGWSSCLIGTVGMLGPIIPPSLLAILYSAATGLSVGAIFLSGVIPGVVLALTLLIVSYHYATRNKTVMENQEKHKRKRTGAEIRALCISVIPALLMPFIIIFGILSGIFTATESAGVACVYAMLYGFISRRLPFKTLWKCLVDSAEGISKLMLIVCLATLFGWILSVNNFPIMVRDAMMSVSSNKYVILLSDGHDSSESQIGGVIARLLQAGIHVYTIGMSGANEAYLKRIADQTGGSFVFAANTSELNRTYADLQRAIMNIYILHYTVEEDEEIRNRILTVRMKNDPAFTRKRYTLGLPKAAGKSGAGEAKSGYYTEIVE